MTPNPSPVPRPSSPPSGDVELLQRLSRARADEVKRTAPKARAALLQAMPEHQVTAAGQTPSLPSPFFVLATQNPIEQEGTYPLPEAQLDRFMFEPRVGYPSKDEEERIVE